MDIELKYIDTYYFCNIAVKILNKIEYVTTLNGFMLQFEYEETFDNEFRYYSVLHQSCEWVADRIIYEDCERFNDFDGESVKSLCDFLNKESLYIDYLTNKYNSGIPSFGTWLCTKFPEENDIIKDVWELFSNYCLDINYDDILYSISTDMFYVLFNNRLFLKDFFEDIAGTVDLGKVKRKSIPVWVKRAVFYRDKGKCVLCHKDLSGLINVPESKDVQYDHIVSLAEGGLNDVANMQLICGNCNRTKSGSTNTNNVHQYWYDIPNT